MSQQPERDDDLDIERLRKQVSEIRTIAPDETVSGIKPGTIELNDFAKRIATQYRDEKFSPSMMTGLVRLCDFVMLFVIGHIVNFFYLHDIKALLWHMPVVAAGAALSVLFLQLADCYQIPALRAPRRAVGRIVGAWARTG